MDRLQGPALLRSSNHSGTEKLPRLHMESKELKRRKKQIVKLMSIIQDIRNKKGGRSSVHFFCIVFIRFSELSVLVIVIVIVLFVDPTLALSLASEPCSV